MLRPPSPRFCFAIACAPVRAIPINGKQASAIWAGVRGSRRASRTCAFCECARQHVGAGWTLAALAFAQIQARGRRRRGDSSSRGVGARLSLPFSIRPGYDPRLCSRVKGAAGAAAAGTAGLPRKRPPRISAELADESHAS